MAGWTPTPIAPPAGQLGWRAPIYLTLSMPTMAALAAMRTPSIVLVINMAPPAMTANAVLLLPSVTLTPAPVVVPLLHATAAMLPPSVGMAIPLVPPPLAAVAQFLTPVISSAINLAAAAPMSAAAAMPAPTIVVGHDAPIAANVMAAVAQLLPPTIAATTGVALASPTMPATAAMPPPTIVAGHDVGITAPVLPATAAMLTPTVVAGQGATIAAPLLAATAAMLTPTLAIIPAGPIYDAIGAGYYSTSTPGSTATWSHTATAGARIIVPTANNTSATIITSAKYGTSTMTQIGSTVTDPGGRYCIWYQLASAPSGAQTVTLTFSQSSGVNIVANSVSATSVTSVSALQSTGGTGVSTLSQAVTCTSSQLAIQSFEDLTYNTISSYSGGTKRWTNSATAGSMTISTATANTTFSATNTNASYWEGLAVVLS